MLVSKAEGRLDNLLEVTSILKKVENSYSTINYWLKSDEVYQRMLKLNKKFVIDLNTSSQSSSDIDKTKKGD
jgi:hypothetical protein